MEPDKKMLEKEFVAEVSEVKNRVIAKFDEIDIKVAEKAIIKNYDDLLHLQERIRKSVEQPFRQKSVLFRLIVFSLSAIFELNFEQLGLLFIYDNNPELTRFLRKFVNIPSISEEELCKTKKWFESFWEEIEELMFQIKADYHFMYQSHTDSEFIARLKQAGKKSPYGITLLLKGINFARWCRSEVIPAKKAYPQTALLRILVYGAMMLRRRSLVGVIEMLHERVFNTLEGYVDVGYALGFYFGIPSREALYKFVTALQEEFIAKIMLENTEELIRIGCADVGMLLVDSTELFGRRDDLDLPAVNRQRATHKMTYRIQIICDPNQIPLLAITRLGNEIDLTGFKSVFEGLLYIKKVADRTGKRIEYILIDAGYADHENLTLIKEGIGATPIFNVNPRTNNDLKLLRKLFKKYGRDYYKKLHDAALSIPEQEQVLIQAKKAIFDPIERICWDLLQTKSELNKFIAREILSVGVENFLEIYARRNVIEGLIGVGKSAYLDLSNKKNKILVIGQEKVSIKVLLILIGLQFRALTNYRVLRRQNLVMKDLYWVNLSEIVINYENMPWQKID